MKNPKSAPRLVVANNADADVPRDSCHLDVKNLAKTLARSGR